MEADRVVKLFVRRITPHCGRERWKMAAVNLPDRTTRRRALALMTEPAKRLSASEVEVVAGVIGVMVEPGPGHARGYLAAGMPAVPGRRPIVPIPGLRVRAAAIESTHVHLLIDPIAVPIDEVTGRLKSATSSAVIANSNEVGRPRARTRTWTAGYWKVFLFDEEGCAAVRAYVEAHNTRRGLAARPWGWIG